MSKRKKTNVSLEQPTIPHIDQPTATMSWWHWLIPPLFLPILSYIFYAPSLHYSFQFDDVANITKFYSIRHNTFKTLFFNNQRWISYWLNTINYHLGKFEPFYYRLFNIIFHTSTAILVFFFVLLALSRLTKKSFFVEQKLSIALTTALLFLLHPVQTQTVSYVIQGQLEGLAGLCIMMMGVCFLLAMRAKSFLGYAALTSFLFILGFICAGTKEIAIVSPILILMTDWFFVAQANIHDLKKRWWVHALLFSIVIGMYVYFLKPAFFKNALGLAIEARNNIGNVLTDSPAQPIKPIHFFISQFKVIVHYIFMFIWPFSISVEYDWKLVSHFFAPDCILPFLFLCSLGALIAYVLKKDRTNIIAFGILWFFIAIAPRSSIIPSSELLADYKTYLGSFGIIFVLALGITYLINTFLKTIENPEIVHHRSLLHLVLICIIAFPVGFLTYQRNKVWRSSEEFWANIIQNAPGKARAYNNLGVALSEQGKMQESIPLYKKAISMDRYYPDPWNNLAVAYSLTDKLELAIETLKEAIRIHPNYPEGYNNLASFMITKKDYSTAETLLKRALELRPYYGKAFFNMGKMFLEQGIHDKALENFKAACTKGDLDNAAGFSIYAQVSMGLQKYQDAIFAYTKLLELQPGHFDSLFNLGNAYFLAGQISEAINLYTKLSAAYPQEGRVWYNLGESYLRIEKPQQALTCFEHAEKLNASPHNIDIRIAACHQASGRIQAARDRLTTCLQKDLPEHIKNTVRIALAQIGNAQQSTAATKS
jgi:tetratricopeptide (TPR) repeat protein